MRSAVLLLATAVAATDRHRHGQHQQRHEPSQQQHHHSSQQQHRLPQHSLPQRRHRKRQQHALTPPVDDARVRAFEAGAAPFDFARDTIVNIHIPKAAGSEFEERVLHTIASPTPCAPAGTRDSFSCKPYSMRCPRSEGSGEEWLLARNTKFGWGCGTHAGFDQQWRCLSKLSRKPSGAPLTAVGLNERARFISIMRDPVDRFVSEYEYSLDGWHPGEPGYKWTQCPPPENVTAMTCEPRRGLEAFAFCPLGQWQSHNRQTRMLYRGDVQCAATPSDAAALRAQEQQMLDSALAAVRSKQVVVGVTERMATTLRYFTHELGLSLNASAGEDFETHEYELDGLTRTRLSELQWMDQAVYAEANKLLDEFERQEDMAEEAQRSQQRRQAGYVRTAATDDEPQRPRPRRRAQRKVYFPVPK